jgi:hypothetical protein
MIVEAFWNVPVRLLPLDRVMMDLGEQNNESLILLKQNLLTIDGEIGIL